MKTIKEGSKGAAVKELQSKLGIKADGVFGPITDRAVRAFQSRKGLVVDGIVGPATWNALGASKPSAPAGPKVGHPLQGKGSVSATFQAHKDRTPPSVNPGTDFAAPTGTPIHASHDGVVAVADNVNDSAGGKWVSIKSGNLETQYLHMSEVWVRKGQTVAKGNVIGKVGSTGNSTGPHVHFVLRINGKNVDAQQYI